MNIKIYLDRYTETCCVPGTQFEQNATVIKFDFSELDFIDDECVKTIHFFHDSLEEANYIGDSIIQNDEFKIPKSITEYENVLAFIQITKSDFIWKTKSFDLHFNQSLDVDKTLDEDQIGILQELVLEVQQIKTDTADEYKQLAEEETKKFNDNATAKTTEFNENAAEKIEEYDNHIEDLDNIVSKNTVNGESIYIDDALEYKVFGAKVDGNVEQTTTTGKQMLQMCAEVREANGLTFTKNIDGSVIIDGTSNATTYCNINTSYTDDNDKKYFSLKQNSYYTVYLKNRTNDVNLAIRTSTINSAIVQLESSEINSGQYTNEDSQTGFAYLQVAANKTFNNLVVYPMIAEGQFSELEWEEYTGGEPSPSPDYPQSIETIRNSVKIKQTGKNLFDSVNYGNLGFWNYNVGQITTMTENERYLSAYCRVVAGKTYTVSRKIISNRFAIAACNEIPNINTTALVLAASSSAKSLTVTVPDNYNYLVLYLQNDGVYTDVGLQIEEGSVATDYEEYKSNEYDIDLQDNELVKLTDDIKDEITIDKNGNVSLSKRIGKVVLNGTENWIFNESGTNYIRFTLFINDLINNQENNKKYVASDYFVSSSIDEAVTDSADANRICAVSNQRLLIKLVNDNVMNLDDFKAWLSENNVTCYYQLLNVSETINLGQLTNFKTYEGVNHFFLEANIATNFEIRYAQDLKKVISKQQAEIDELKTLLSSTTTSALLLDNYASDLVSEIESEVEQ